MSETFQILIADDHPLVRGALKQALSTELDNVTLYEAGSLFEAIEQIEAHKGDIDLVLLDLHMPGMNGFTGLFTLRASYPDIPVSIVSASQDMPVVRRSIEYGASAFVPKSAPVDQIGLAVKTVLDGGMWMPDWARDAMENGPADDEATNLAEKIGQLTPQQLRVLNMLTEGKLNKQIAYELDVTEATVKAHVSAILRKLSVHSRTQAVIIARELQLQEPAIET
ncbi:MULTISPECIES: response regulator [Thalassospira]|jgi:DNA-binding NarL/FixJ family response regulator|uniref:DNA-binding response regulator n=2 Tax=Thalassospira TaxID=168934 RepID=A0A358HVH8_9PROT|nr:MULTISPECIES: response regulator transcription factor [Thalassospira]MBV17944.1 DNA-binding response regulator [Thalassospira sp.]PKR57585.1 DNA-binding response regulator [Thalassospira lohafexi]HBU99178.1 DNA-binding response regulator [Thalassospira lucentensis]HCW66054.1 DNA-binding response regulator [Thalassospira lucentensis]|tara:strand:- start:52390 stop:53061 length:672 start_codon:yes stop_codon:yes gene_type:complete